MKTDVEYALKQLRIIIDSGQPSAMLSQDCAQRAIDALERVLEELNKSPELDYD